MRLSGLQTKALRETQPPVLSLIAHPGRTVTSHTQHLYSTSVEQGSIVRLMLCTGLTAVWLPKAIPVAALPQAPVKMP